MSPVMPLGSASALLEEVDVTIWEGILAETEVSCAGLKATQHDLPWQVGREPLLAVRKLAPAG